MHDINDVLSSVPDLTMLLETSSNNTRQLDWDYFDAFGSAFGYMDSSVEFTSNADVVYSNRSAGLLDVTRLLSSEVTDKSELSDPYSGSSGKEDISSFVIHKAGSTESLLGKNFENTNYTFKIGGTIHPSQADEERIPTDEYPVFAKGYFEFGTANDDLVLTAKRFQRELLSQWPLNKYGYGLSTGKAKDFLYGNFNNRTAKPVELGLSQFHDGVISDNPDKTINFYPYAGFQDGISYGRLDMSEPSGVSSPYLASDFFFTSVNAQEVQSAAPFDISITASNNSVVFTPQNKGQSIRMDQSSSAVTSYADDFSWVIDKQTVSSKGKTPVTVTVDKPITITETKGRWFKITGPSGKTGRVTFKFDRAISAAKLRLQNINQSPEISIGNWSIDPISVSPEYGEDVSSVVTFAGVQTNEISFDFTGNGVFPTGNLVAMWIDELTLYEEKPCRLTIKSNVPLNYLTLSFFAGNGEKVSHYSDEPAVTFDPIGTGITELTWVDLNKDQIEIDWVPATGQASLSVVSAIVSAGAYGAFISDEIIELKPEDESSAAVIGRIIDRDVAGNDSDVEHLRRLTFRARVVGRDDVELNWGYVANDGVDELPIKVNASWQEYKYDAGRKKRTGELGGSDAVDGLYLKADRVGDAGSDYTVQISHYADYLAQVEENDHLRANSVKTINSSESEIVYRNSFKVSDVSDFGKVPSDFTLYDPNGWIKHNESFRSVTGKFHGINAIDKPAYFNGAVYDLKQVGSSVIISVGDFSEVDGVECNNLAFIGDDGVLDLSTDFGGSKGSDGPIRCSIISAAGKIYIAGDFDNVAETASSKIARLNVDGTIDSSFDADTIVGSVHSIIEQADAKIIVVGSISSANGSSVNDAVRLNSDGTVDATFSPPALATTGVYKQYFDVLINGSDIYMSGVFKTVGGHETSSVVKVSSTGVVDTAFHAPQFDSIFYDWYFNLSIIDGELVALGSSGLGEDDPFGEYQDGGNIKKLDLDTGRSSVSEYVGETASSNYAGYASLGESSIAADGTIKDSLIVGADLVIAGHFKSCSSERFHPSVSRRSAEDLDSIDERDTAQEYSGWVNSILELADGTFMVGGLFTGIGNLGYSNLALLGDDLVNKTDLTLRKVCDHMASLAGAPETVHTDSIDGPIIQRGYSNQKPVIDRIRELTSYTDTFYTVGEDNKITLRQRYDGVRNPEEFSITENIKKGSVKWVGSVGRQSSYSFDYWDSISRGETEPNRVSSPENEQNPKSARIIPSPVTEKADADYLVGTFARDSKGASLYTLVLVGVGYNLRRGMVGRVDHEDIPSGFDVEIKRCTRKLNTKETDLTVIVYDRG